MAAPAMALIVAFSIALAVLIIIFVLVPLLKVIGILIGKVFQAVAWLIGHVFEFIFGEIGDVLRFVGTIFATILLVPLTMLNVVIGRWSSAGHFAESVKREIKIGATCLYRIAIRRPLNFVLLHGLLEGIEQRVPEAMAGAPTADRPKRRTGQFEGYNIVGSLRGGGSGGKLYVAQPSEANRRKGMPDRVVIKSFALTEGSSLPQIVRESRALEAARQMGLVLDHGMEEHRFFYVMPFHDGDHLGVITRQMHGESDGRGLSNKQLAGVMQYTHDLLQTLSAYHKGGLWHKDVKPENVIIHDGTAHLVDLGLVTPLRSAMTLTTHGTEYFRDPEMVRQALQGVKVHQVDGTKFDIYAVGAVLYFVLEGTFPAHGGLSRFKKKSPEAVRWIVKRAMTDYNQRYGSVTEMLADVNVVMQAQDPYAVKPAALPSMRGGPFVMDEEPDEVAQVFQARSPQPPHAGAEAVASAGPAAAAAGVQSYGAAKRPKLRVTSWWTGEYQVDDPGTGSDPAGATVSNNTDYRDFRSQARAFRAEAGELHRRMRAGAITARSAAREQVRVARARAHEMRRKARQRRYSYKASDRPTPFLAFLVMSVLVGGAIIGAALVKSNGDRRSYTQIITAPGASARASSSVSVIDDASKPPVLLVVDVPNRYDEDVLDRIGSIVESNRAKYNVVVEDEWTEEHYNDMLKAWIAAGRVDRGEANEKLESAMDEDDLYGILQVTANSKGRINGGVINSSDPDARKRRREASDPVKAVSSMVVSHAPTDRPILIVNDHPASHDPKVETRIESILKTYLDRGWNLKSDIDAEVPFREALPMGVVDETMFDTAKLNMLMAKWELGGVLHITATPGDGKPEDRIARIMILNEDLQRSIDDDDHDHDRDYD